MYFICILYIYIYYIHLLYLYVHEHCAFAKVFLRMHYICTFALYELKKQTFHCDK